MRIGITVAAVFVIVIGIVLYSDHASGRVHWHLPDGGRASLSQRDYGYELVVRHGTGGGTEFPIYDKSTLDAELRTDDEGSYWLVDRARSKVLALADRPKLTIGSKPPAANAEAEFTSTSGRALPRSRLFGFW